MSAEARKLRRSVASRVFASYVVVTLAFSAVAGWSVASLRGASREAEAMRSGYLPVALALRDVVSGQDTWNTQLNHVTAAANPADQRVWFDTALQAGRPHAFSEVRAAIARAFGADPALTETGSELSAEATVIEQLLEGDRDLLARLFEARNHGDSARAEKLRDELVTRGHQARKRLAGLEQRVELRVEALLAEARRREVLALRLLVSLAIVSFGVGVFAAFYVRRVLAPLGAVTERAKAVARGDLTPHPAVASDDEIGELATTFEGMVAEISRANRELVSAERLATVGKMAAHVTHEIRNPLSSLALNVELLEEELAGRGGEELTLLRAIKGEVERLTALSEQYLSVARRRAPRFAEEDVGEVVREAIEFVRPELRRHQVEIESHFAEGVSPAWIDEGQVKQVLFNLLRNAREAMPGGGAVRVEVSARAGGGVEIRVEDQGEGIDDETRARLFEPFFTTKGHGTGLGLVITHQIVEAHGGSIRVEPRLPQGARFVVQLPARAG